MKRSRFYFGFLWFLNIVIFEKVWFILLAFSCDDTCLSWIEFIFDLGMWASILVYIFGVIMEAMMIIFHTFMLLYDTFIMIMHVIMMYTLWCWCTPIHYDVHAYHSVMMLSYALWCILDSDDALMMHTEMLMYILWWGCIPYDDDA